MTPDSLDRAMIIGVTLNLLIGSSSSGGWGHNIDELFIGVPGLHTVAVADDMDTGVTEALSRHRLTQTTRGFLDWRRMLADIKPDVVAICSRNWPPICCDRRTTPLRRATKVHHKIKNMWTIGEECLQISSQI